MTDVRDRSEQPERGGRCAPVALTIEEVRAHFRRLGLTYLRLAHLGAEVAAPPGKAHCRAYLVRVQGQPPAIAAAFRRVFPLAEGANNLLLVRAGAMALWWPV